MENLTIILDGKPINYNKSDDLWETIAKNSDNVVFSCAGTGKCGKCKIKMLNHVEKPTEDEKNLLTAEEIEQNIRLACLIDAKDGLNLETIKKEQDNLEIATGSDDISVSNALFENFVIAIDIGTTTLVASLYSKDGQISKVSRKNPQVKYGTDVISRIEIHLKDREILKNLIASALNEMILQVCGEISVKNIDSVVITGNTTMLYILTGRDVSSLATAPFEAEFLFDNMVTAKIENGAFRIDVIGDVKPIGICGSGLIDIMSALLEVEAIDETGALDEDILEDLNMTHYVDDKLAVKITDDVYLTDADIRKIQLAKGAISAGAKTIIETNGIDMESIDKVYITGGFGSFLDIKSACDIGLLPKNSLEKYKIIGNAALDGAARILCDKSKIGFPFENIYTTGIDLSTKPEFTSNFMECMMFM